MTGGSEVHDLVEDSMIVAPLIWQRRLAILFALLP